MAEVIISLLAWVKLLGGYPIPEHPPQVIFVPHAVLQAEACHRPCPVLGWFPPGDRIYLDDRLDPEHDVRARGILVHELVHYAQSLSTRFDGLDECSAVIAREREAYDVQNRWLAANGALPGQVTPMHVAPCQPVRGLTGGAPAAP